jgi:DNA/RNA-binding domain of Phe-tRNA-synthetase-like protein
MLVREELGSTLRSKYSQANREELKALHPMDAYVLYYKKFGYTYHVLQQFESVIKNKPIPVGLPSVDAMFLAELKNMILTAGHDLDKIKAPLSLRVAEGSESYTSLSGRTVMTIPNDIMIADQEGVISSILRGPDLQTAITARTTRVIYTVYAPPEVEEQLVSNHLKDIEAYVKIVSEKSVTRLSRVFGG